MKQRRRPADRIVSSRAANFNSVAVETSKGSRQAFRRWVESKGMSLVLSNFQVALYGSP